MPRKLAVYRAKRDFSKTAEPSGRHAVVGGPRLRYVIQKHAARRLHYDLRLELDGVFRSWAVTRGPSLDPADKRLAVEVEDHPLDYGDFEGAIPQGEYGGGTVQLWDRGYWEPEGTASPQAQLKSGDLKFTLQGERLHGSWVLVRMRHDRNGGKRTNWLLIKHRDAEARSARAAAALLEEDRSVASGRKMAQIAAGTGAEPTSFMDKAQRVSASATWSSHASPATAMKEKPGVVGGTRVRAGRGNYRLPEFIEPALCRLATEPPSGEDWVHEVKLDGYRLQLRVRAGRATFKTRKGLDWTRKFAATAEAARDLPDCLIDGEMVAMDDAGRPNFAALQAALSENKTSALVFYAFDLLGTAQGDLRQAPLRERKQQLQDLLAPHAGGPIRYVEHLDGAAKEIWQSACQMALEGIISKRADAPYRSGRGGDWIKTKCRAGHEVVIGGWTSQGGQLRSLLVGVMRAGHLVYVGRVGTGFGAQISRRLQPQLRKLTTDVNPFQGMNAPRQESNVQWLRPELVAEIEFAGWTGGGMVRQAAFKGLRADKPASEVRTELPSPPPEDELMPNPKSKIMRRKPAGKPAGKPEKPSRASPASGGVIITHPDKALWPDAGDGRPVSKQDLADYYRTIGEWLLEHIRGRPCSLVRAPDGFSGEQFFQRHAMAGHAPQLGLIKVSGDRKPYLLIDSIDALQAVAQIGGLELHPWNCAPGKPDVPGRLVFDLDPAPEIKFSQVIEAALEMRGRLQSLGMESFCKTTGGKGLHVVVNLLPPAAKRDSVDWPAAKLFAQTVCAQMAADNPRRYLINMSKAARTGKIFLDYLRNDRMATAVAPLSPRARAGATVSMPLNWQQVRGGLDPKRYTVRSAPDLLRRDRPWRDYAAAAVSLAAAARRLLAGGAAHAA